MNMDKAHRLKKTSCWRIQNDILFRDAHIQKAWKYAWALMMKFRQGLTSRERKKERNMIGEEYKGNFNYICNTVFLKLTAVNLDFFSFCHLEVFYKKWNSVHSRTFNLVVIALPENPHNLCFCFLNRAACRSIHLHRSVFVRMGERVSGTKVQLVHESTHLVPSAPKPQDEHHQEGTPPSLLHFLLSSLWMLPIYSSMAWKARKKNQSAGRVSIKFISCLHQILVHLDIIPGP